MVRRAELDGLRGLAILLVVAHHAHLPGMAGGWIGVDLFFALSGYLITGILLRTRGQPGYWRRFVERRARRILPLYLLLLVGVAALRLAGLDTEPAAPWWSYATFTANYCPGLYSPTIRVIWSLCIEEQFYLVWPWVVLLGGRRGVALASAVAIVGAPLLRTVLASHEGWEVVYNYTPCRADAIAVGAVAALAAGSTRWQWPALGGMLVGAVVVAAFGADRHAAAFQPSGYSGLALTCGCLVYLAGQVPVAPLRWAWLRWLGRISYGLYLLHLPAWYLLGWPGLILSPLIAELSWRYVESPWQRYREREAYTIRIEAV